MLGLGNNLARGGVLSGLTNAYSLEFDGTSAYVSVGDTANLSGLSALTISAWVKPNSVSIDQVVCSKSTDVDWDSNSEFQIQLSNDDIMFHIYDIDNDAYLGRQTTGDEFAIGQWYHIGCTWDGSTTSSGLKIYINGIQTDDSDHASGSGFATMRDTATPVLIGARNNDLSASSKHRFWNGNIDEVAIWNTALSAGSISNIYNNRVPTDLLADSNSANLQGWWRMGDGTLDSFNLIADQVNPTLGSDLASSLDWNNNGSDPYETLTTSGNSVTEADNTSGWGIASTDTFSLTTGIVYKLVFDFTLNSGAVPNKVLIAVNSDLGSLQKFIITGVENGLQTHYFTVDATRTDYRFGVRENSATNWSLSALSIKPVNGNPGLMTNMASEDIVKDTP